MNTFTKLKSIWDNHKKTVIIVASSVFAVLFIGSILLAVFIGGEFKKEEVITYDVRGAMTIVKPGDYKTEYVDGDFFVFDKTKNQINLIVKYADQEDFEKIDNLDAAEYGFRVNGEGDIYEKADEIVITSDVKYVSVVWVSHPHIKVNIGVKIVTE